MTEAQHDNPLYENVTGLATVIHLAIGEGCPDDGDGATGCFDAAHAILRSDWLKAREAAARREALLEAAEHFTARANAAHRDDLHMVSDTWDMAAADLRALAEPERDEEPCSCGSRDATSLTPGEWLHHSPDACTIERDKGDGR